jgi:hypothetical protein
MGFGDDYYTSSVILDVVNLVITLSIIGVLFYLYISYADFQKKVKERLEEYNKKKPSK